MKVFVSTQAPRQQIEVSGQLQAPVAVLPPKQSQVQISQQTRCGPYTAGLNPLEKIKISCHCLESKHPAAGSHYTEYAAIKCQEKYVTSQYLGQTHAVCRNTRLAAEVFCYSKNASNCSFTGTLVLNCSYLPFHSTASHIARVHSLGLRP